MKPAILMALCALSLSLHVAAAEEDAPVMDHRQVGFEAPGTESLKAAAIPEAGAVVLGLVGAMMLLCRRR